MIDETRLTKVLGILWQHYMIECPFAAKAAKVWTFVGPLQSDHIAFRSVLPMDFDRLVKFWGLFGYQKAKEYDLGNKAAIHMEKPGFPKIFISAFRIANLEGEVRKFVFESFSNSRRIGLDKIDDMNGGYFECKMEILPAEELVNYLTVNPCLIPPTEDELNTLNEIDQYIAWTRLFGQKVNHFTLSVNKFREATGYDEWDITKVHEQMSFHGIPMKEDIEGVGTELAQTSTRAASVKVPVFLGTIAEGANLAYIDWPYAYYEIAERGMTLFEDFKAAQTPGLFAMTGKDRNE